VGTPEQVATKVVGTGQAVSTHIGTVRWLIVDDNGSHHGLQIPRTRFQSSLPFRLLCPQHVAQVYKDPKTTCLTLMDKAVFVWGQGKWKQLLPLHKSSNVGLMWSAPSNNKFFPFTSNVTAGNRVSDSDMETWRSKTKNQDGKHSQCKPTTTTNLGCPNPRGSSLSKLNSWMKLRGSCSKSLLMSHRSRQLSGRHIAD
jgi:hypothetical protein